MSKAEKTKAFIIEKTAPIFNRKGYAGTSLSDMTEATGLTKGSIYGNFEDKDAVALAAFDHNVKVVSRLLQPMLEKKASYREKLLTYLEIYGNQVRLPFFGNGCPIMNTATEADDTHPALRKRAGEALLTWKDTLAKLIREGIAAGEFKKDTNPEQAGLTIIALIEGAILFTRATGSNDYRKPILDSLEKLINEL